MKEYLLRILGDAAVFAAIGSFLMYFVKKWLEGFLDNRFKQELEIAKADLDIQKERLRKLEEKRDFIYPEILELVYRLRNDYRDIVSDITVNLEEYKEAEAAVLVKSKNGSQNKSQTSPSGNNNNPDDVESDTDNTEDNDNDDIGFPRFWSPSELGQRLYKLTENLYTYRAYIEEETFDNLHRFKRILQDAQVMLNRITRPTDDFLKHYDTVIQRCMESIDNLQKINLECDELYKKITGQIQDQVKASLHEKRA